MDNVIDIHEVCKQLDNVEPCKMTKMPKRLSRQQLYLQILQSRLNWAIGHAPDQKEVEAFSRKFLAIDSLGDFLQKSAGNLRESQFFLLYEGAIMPFIQMVERRNRVV